jgi:hypothetical protein
VPDTEAKEDLMEQDPTQQRGTGTPVSADDYLDDAAMRHEPTADDDVDPAVVTGATARSNPAAGDEIDPNRSGSGGSGGGSALDAEGEEGSGQESMTEMLSGDEGTLA